MPGGSRSYEMAKRMVEAGHEVHMITTWRDSTDQSGWWVQNVDGIQVHWIPIRYSNKTTYRKRITAFIRFAIAAGRKAVSIGGDVVFATSTPLTIAIPAIYAAKRLRRPMVFEVRDLWPTLPIAMGALRNPIVIAVAKWLERVAYWNSKEIVALSPGMAEGVTSLGYPAENVHVIPNSCDNYIFGPNLKAATRFRSAHPELGEGHIVLYAGTFGRVNGVEFLPELAARIYARLPDTRFIAIGGGTEFAAVRNRAEELGVLGNSYFQYEQIPKLELANAFAAASISTSLVINLAELRHNSANKFFDTLASGTAIAINYNGWQADIIQEYEVGVVLGSNIDEAADRLIQTLEDPKRLELLGVNARQLALSVFDRDKLASELISVLERATAKEDC